MPEPRHPWQFQCGTKRCYRSEAAAQQHLAQMQAEGLFQRPTRAYECPWCGAWHLGHLRVRRMQAEVRHAP